MNLKNVGADSISAHQRGITLIALVVTLVVLLILAGITINLAISEGGILVKANQAKEKQEVAEMLEKLTVAEASTATNYLAVDLEKYKAELKTEGIVKQDDSNYIISDDRLSYELTSDKGYVFTVTEPTKGDIVIDYEGKEGKLSPKIIDIKAIEKTASSIKTQVNVIRLENGKLSYYYKKQADADYITFKENTTEKEVNFIGLTQNQIYTIKVVAQNSFGKSNELIVNIVAGELQAGTISQKGTTTWTNGQASIELQTTMPSFEMQYQINGIDGKWLKYTGAITGLKYNDIVYARLWDGMNGSASSSVQIMDEVIPKEATITLSNERVEVGTKVTATVIQKDEESEINITKCKWVYNTTDTEIGTNEENYTGGTFTTNPQTITLNASTAGTYYLHVLTIDKAENKKESISNAVTVNQLATGISLNQTSETIYTGNTLTLIAIVTPTNTTNKNVTWTSSNTEVATVTNGIIAAKATGTTVITATTVDGSNKTAICTITVKQAILISRLKAGDYVAYTGGGYSSWRVLWEANNSIAGNESNVQIISTGSVEKITLGSENYDIARNSYYSSTGTLNYEAMPYINSTYAVDARCVGSVPNNKNLESGKAPDPYGYLANFGGFIDGDINYEKDYNQMTTLGIQNIGFVYWTASRAVAASSYSTIFRVRAVGDDGNMYTYSLCYVYALTNKPMGSSITHGFRPVVSLKPDIKITGGDGSQESPWQLGI